MKKKHKKWKERKWELGFLLPSLIGVSVFFVVPFGVIFYYSMVDSPIDPRFVFFRNFVNLFHNSAFLQAAKNTAVFSLTAVPLAVLLSLGMAIILEQNIPLRSTFRTFFLTPLMVPTASIVLIWQVFFIIMVRSISFWFIWELVRLTGLSHLSRRLLYCFCSYGRIWATI